MLVRPLCLVVSLALASCSASRPPESSRDAAGSQAAAVGPVSTDADPATSKQRDATEPHAASATASSASSAIATQVASDPSVRVDEAAAQLPATLVEEAWVSPEFLADELDSIASYRNRAGEMLLFVTAKEGNHLRVFDAATGAPRGVVGQAGKALGEFLRPNGIAAIDGILFVAERDVPRVQVLDAESRAPLGSFGEDALISPYGIYLERIEPGRYRAYVTDSYREKDGNRPPDAELGRRVREYSVVVRDKFFEAREVRHFGAKGGPDSLHIVESISGDPMNDRLLVAEEDARNGQVLKAYDFSGNPRGEHVGKGVYAYQPEGIALRVCGDDGYWVASDQHETGQRYHVFDRNSLEHVGTFRGAHARMTDGIWMEPEPFGPFEAGAVFAQHDDRAVVAFDWAKIRAALKLRPDC